MAAAAASSWAAVKGRQEAAEAVGSPATVKMVVADTAAMEVAPGTAVASPPADPGHTASRNTLVVPVASALVEAAAVFRCPRSSLFNIPN